MVFASRPEPLGLLYDQGFIIVTIIVTSKSRDQFVAPWEDIDVRHGMGRQGSAEGADFYFDVYTFVNRKSKASL